MALTAPSYEGLRQHWERFYKTYLGLNVDFSQVSIPQRTGEKQDLVFVRHGIDAKYIISKVGKRRRCLIDTLEFIGFEHKWPRLISQKRPEKDYAFWTPSPCLPEAFPEGKSQKNLLHDGIIFLTLEEYLLYAVEFSIRRGEAPDSYGTTLTSTYDEDGYAIASADSTGCDADNLSITIFRVSVGKDYKEDWSNQCYPGIRRAIL